MKGSTPATLPGDSSSSWNSCTCSAETGKRGRARSQFTTFAPGRAGQHIVSFGAKLSMLAITKDAPTNAIWQQIRKTDNTTTNNSNNNKNNNNDQAENYTIYAIYELQQLQAGAAPALAVASPAVLLRSFASSLFFCAAKLFLLLRRRCH